MEDVKHSMSWFQNDIQKQLHLTFTLHILYNPVLLVVALLSPSGLWSMAPSSDAVIILRYCQWCSQSEIILRQDKDRRGVKYTHISDASSSVISLTVSGHWAKAIVNFLSLLWSANSFFFFFVTTTECDMNATLKSKESGFGWCFANSCLSKGTGGSGRR